MRKILLIGVGAGDVGHVTFQAAEAIRAADVVFLPDKGAEKAGLREHRLAILTTYRKGKPARLITFAARGRGQERADSFSDYRANVEDWHAAIARDYEEMFSRELGEDEAGAFLVWGDPTLYDSTLRILDAIRARKTLPLDYEVIPGITSVQALCARHKIALNEIGEPALITTGRRLREGGFPACADSVVVMLDGEASFDALADDGFDIYWSANLGRPEEASLKGPLGAVRDAIKAARAVAREKAGFVMDVYLLRRRRN